MCRFYVAFIAGLLTSVVVPAVAMVVREPMPPEVSVGFSDFSGLIYTTALGMTLYVTGMDEAKPGTFGCTEIVYKKGGRGAAAYSLPRAEHRESCLDRRPIFAADETARPVGKWSIVDRPNGQQQWAYDGHPLYLSKRDRAPGDVSGTFGYPQLRTWLVVPLPTRFPRGIKLIHKIDGLMLGAESERLIMTIGPRGKDSAEWEPMIASELDRPFGDWDLVTRKDGSRHWSYKNMPLYQTKDDRAIQTNVASGRWKPIVFHKAKDRPKFLTMQMILPEIGWVYADTKGRTLYAFICFDRTPDQLSCDEIGDPAAHRSAICGPAADCAREWRPVPAGPADKPAGYWAIADVPEPPFVNATDAYGENVPTVKAWTYHGRPVYTFSGDKKPGDFYGHTIESVTSAFGALAVLGDQFPARP